MATIQKRPVAVAVRAAEPGEQIETREETLTADAGDLIITGVHGEVYPISPEIFVETYAPADEAGMDLYRECLPEGVRVEFETVDTVTLLSGVCVDPAELDANEIRDAEAFARRLMESSPNVPDASEVVYV
jgi:hypothetical protein